MSTSEAQQVLNLLYDSIESSCAARSNADHQRQAIPRATATRRLRASLIGQQHHAPAGDLLLTSLLSGTVKIMPPVSQLTRNGVQFADGSYIDNVDAIICATGQLSIGVSDTN